MLTQIIKSRLIAMPMNIQIKNMYIMGCYSARSFAPQAPKKVALPFKEPLSVTELLNISEKNVKETKPVDYSEFIKSNALGVTNKVRTFRSQEEKVNANFPLSPTGAIDRNSKRCGAIGYKVGMTHFWNKWGAMVPCTVIQLDRCQVTQIKTLEKDGINAI
jgi:hypothetical protein